MSRPAVPKAHSAAAHSAGVTMKRFSSILIANRGEIAVRIAHTAHRLGYRVVAVYSDADAQALHVRAADQAIRIGPPAPHDSYLNIPAILAAAQQSGADAVHPGYGFLAENPDFAQAVLDAGMVWIGPTPEAILAMGNKAQAKRLMHQAGVACVPGYDGELQDDATLRAQAHDIGYPLMIKATAGGGGRGMRLVACSAEFDAALASARSESLAAFGEASVLLERAVPEPRHVEIQVFADTQGHVVHMGERDCSVQRRHQKLIEEAPSPALAGERGRQLRRRMGDMAVAATRAVRYCGAGTVECLLDAQGNFYFMEMNTRLQVEHPVTEALTGYDLVEWQLRVAQGEALPETSQGEILRRFEAGGHAVEVRLCAEDPAHHFLPQSGRLLAWQPSTQVRVEHALEPGADISPYYDSMLAKLVAHGPDRATACQSLADALRSSTALGVRTSQSFLAACLEHPVFAGGQANTGFIAAHKDAVLATDQRLRTPLAALLLYAMRAQQLGHDPTAVALPLPWQVPMRFVLDGEAAVAALQALGGSRYRVVCGGVTEDFTVLTAGKANLRVAGDGGTVSIACVLDQATVYASVAGHQTVVTDKTLASPERGSPATAGSIRAPMAGRIVALHVAVGQAVTKGTPLVVLEAMKMEHPSAAPMDALVARVCTEQGAQVAAGSLLIELVQTP